jgi:predicted transcriptional regulator
MKLNKTDELVIKTLKTEGKELTLQELTDKTGEPQKKVFKSLKKLFEHELITTQARKYSLTGKPVPTGKKGKDEDVEDLPEA